MKILRIILSLILALSCASLNFLPAFYSTPQDLPGYENTGDIYGTENTDATSSYPEQTGNVPSTDIHTSFPITDGTRPVVSSTGGTSSYFPSTDTPNTDTPKTDPVTPDTTPQITEKEPPKQETTTTTKSTEKTKAPETEAPKTEPATSEKSDKPIPPDTSLISPETGPERYERTALNEEIRGVWVATVYRIDFPSASRLSAADLKKELRALVDTTEELGMNTIFFQVRPTGDALYKSKIFPSSHWVTGTQGAAFPDDLDILQYLIEYAHSKDIAVHAWINPYRVTNSSSMALSKDNPASKHPEWTFTVEGSKCYDPGIPEVIDLICRGVAEIVENYDVDGIIYDDYFYPGGDDFKHTNPKNDIDYGTFLKYGKGYDNIADWRRSNVNALVRATFETVKSIDKNCIFGVSPRGVWNNKSDEFPSGSDTKGSSAYQSIFCDALAWANGRYVDYISPQIYWRMSSLTVSFRVLDLWWTEALEPSKTPLIISYNVYDLSAEETLTQVAYARSLDNYYGYIMYRYGTILESKDRRDVIKGLGAYYKKED